MFLYLYYIDCDIGITLCTLLFAYRENSSIKYFIDKSSLSFA